MKFAEDNSPLTDEFAAACDNPQDLDCSFAEQRRDSGYANFDFDPAEAAALRQTEQDRIDGVSGQDRESYSDDQDRDSYTVDPDLDKLEEQAGIYDIEDDEFDDEYDIHLEDEDENDYDRFRESYGDDFEDDEDEEY